MRDAEDFTLKSEWCMLKVPINGNIILNCANMIEVKHKKKVIQLTYDESSSPVAIDQLEGIMSLGKQKMETRYSKLAKQKFSKLLANNDVLDTYEIIFDFRNTLAHGAYLSAHKEKTDIEMSLNRNCKKLEEWLLTKKMLDPSYDPCNPNAWNLLSNEIADNLFDYARKICQLIH